MEDFCLGTKEHSFAPKRGNEHWMLWFTNFQGEPLFHAMNEWTGDPDEVVRVWPDGHGGVGYLFADRLRSSDELEFIGKRLASDGYEDASSTFVRAASFLRNGPQPRGRIYFVIEWRGEASVFSCYMGDCKSYLRAVDRWRVKPSDRDVLPYEPGPDFCGYAFHNGSWPLGLDPLLWTLKRGKWMFPDGDPAEAMRQYFALAGRLFNTHVTITIDPSQRCNMPRYVRNFAAVAPPDALCFATLTKVEARVLLKSGARKAF